MKIAKKGIYAKTFGGGQVDITKGKFVFSASEAYLIENGKPTSPLKGATLIGNGPQAMNQISMIGNDLKLDEGVGTCGKEGQGVPVGVGQPTIRMSGITIGGTEFQFLININFFSNKSDNLNQNGLNIKLAKADLVTANARIGINAPDPKKLKNTSKYRPNIYKNF